MRARRPAVVLAVAASIAALACAPRAARAHGLEPASLTLRETPSGTFDVRWQSAGVRLPGADVQPILPPSCRRISAGEAAAEVDRVVLRFAIDCRPTGIAGATFGATDLAAAKINALLRIERLSGEPVQVVLTPAQPTYVVPTPPTTRDVATGAAARGAAAALTEPDRVLLLGGLLLLAGTRRGAAKAIAALALGQSLTVALLGPRLAGAPWPWGGAVIAASLLVVALELARPAQSRSPLRRLPWAGALLFGVVQGSSVAAALPADGAPSALLALTAGFETAQIALAGLVLALAVGVARLAPAAAPVARRVAVYAMGILAAFWCLERLLI